MKIYTDTDLPDFVMHVVMLKTPDSKVFFPCWELWDFVGHYARGFKRKQDADQECKRLRAVYGKKNAYVQQYGPYS